MAYKRGDEGPASVFYKAYAKFYDETPSGIRRLVNAIESATDLPRRGVSTWPTDARTVEETAAAFAEAARNIYFAELDLDSKGAAQLDRFAREHLIDPNLRPLLDDSEKYGAAMEAEDVRVPDEPLLFYAMGCFIGEWLVRHAGCRWFLHAPLDPIQSFPDLLRTGTLTTLAPFSLATKLLADPVGASIESLLPALPSATLYLPIALCATVSDSEEALRELAGPKIERATELLKERRQEEAFDLVEAAVEKNKDNGHFLHQVAALGWDYHEYGIVHRASELQLELAPDSTEAQHNFAAIESMREGGLEPAIKMLERLLESDPGYARTRLTLASCYQEAGQKLKAMAQAQWLLDNEPEYAEPAQSLLDELG
ncbi:MAG: tetratricopeptide repeat protein [Planctomycetota bacterium]|jgi:tetratricopeptide (TPR) repeat protein